MSRRRSRFPALIVTVALAAVPGARAQQAPPTGSTVDARPPARGQEPLRRLDAGALAGGDYGADPAQPQPLAGGTYGQPVADQPPLAGGDYGIPSRPEASAATIAPTVLSDPLGAGPSGFRATGSRAPAVSADDPYAPLGVEAGAFLLRPTIETAGGHDDNPNRLPGAKKGSSFLRLRGELDAQSDWSRHALGLRTSGQIRKYQDEITGLQPEFSATATGRLDVTERTQINSELRASIVASRPGDPETTVGVKDEEVGRSAGATLGVAQRFNRFGMRLDGLVDRFTVDDAKLIEGGKIDNSDRAYNQYEARLRGAYELNPALEPFVEAAVVTRDYDKRFSSFDTDPDGGGVIPDRRRLGSDGYALRSGARFEMSRLVTGEAAIGYGRQTPKDGDLKPVDGLLLDGSIAWAPTGLTTVRFDAKSALQETSLANSGGVFARNFSLAIEHRLRRNFIVTARAGFDRADYRGAGRRDDAYTHGLDAEYRLTRDIALTGSLERIWLDSSLPGEDYNATIVEIGLRFRR